MNKHTHTWYTSVLRGNPNREKTTECFFLYVLKNYFIGSTNFLCFPTTTGRRLQPPSFSNYNLMEAPTSQFFGYNQKEATTPYVLRLQPPVLALSCHPEVEVE
jgi:hypothetical protein